MTYRARGRSIFEVILAVCFVGFLVGFITVLCIGNYFRAKRAQERQRQRRMAKITSSGSNQLRTTRNGSSISSPRLGLVGESEASYPSSETGSNFGYEAPHLPTTPGGGARS